MDSDHARSESVQFAPQPGSALWRASGDPRVLAGAGYALVMQVAHPTVAAGVREHSNYATDPWGRLIRTLDYTYVMVFGGARAAASTGRELREMHKQIRGIAPNGSRYHALEPEAFAWVHGTLIEATVTAHKRFGRRLSRVEIDSMYADWLALGRLIGVRGRDLPDSWGGFLAYFEEMKSERLEDSDVVQGVATTLARPPRPDLPFLADPVWRAARLPMGRIVSLATAGLLAPRVRERLCLSWSARQEAELRALGAASRAVTPVLPERLRMVGPAYLRWRGLGRAG